MKVFAGLLFIFLAGFLVFAEAGYRVCPTDRKSCYCTFDWNPVCSKIGCTYPNECKMKCAGQQLWHHGECKPQPPHYG